MAEPGFETKNSADLVLPFDSDREAEVATTGGKGWSLIFATGQGLPVPPGFALTTEFFEPWVLSVKGNEEWKRLLAASPEIFAEPSRKLRQACAKLKLDERRSQALEDALARLADAQTEPLFAVRSSSPEEDLECASFAGSYETSLGVSRGEVLEALRVSFSSVLNERVFAYKRERNFPVERLHFAAVVQTQIHSEISGVAFSLNPLNNCYDETVINANYGLGESVVTGLVMPDSFVVDRVKRTVIERKAGRRETIIYLDVDGSVRTETNMAASPCLSDKQAVSVSDLAVRVESLYQKPVDIEWAFVGETLHLLQARPVTAYVPLPEPMLTKSGEKKRLYWDATLAKQGLHEPFSVLGTDIFDALTRSFAGEMFGRDVVDMTDGLYFNLEGRSYANLSNAFRVLGRKRMARSVGSSDTLSSDIIAAIDEREYGALETPRKLRGLVFNLLRINLGAFLTVYRIYRDPTGYKERFSQWERSFVRELEVFDGQHADISVFLDESLRFFSTFLMKKSLPMTFAAEIARAGMKRIFKRESAEIRDKLVYLERSLPNNVTIEMGLAMYRLACRPELKACASAADFTERLADNDFPSDFLNEWRSFVEKYGFRGPRELDVAEPGFGENPAKLFEQLRVTAQNSSPSQNPQAVFDQAKEKREATFEELLKLAGGKGKKFSKRYRVLVELGGFRELHKYYIIVILDKLRGRALAAGRTFQEQGRLERAEQVFDLQLRELQRALEEPSLDLRPLMEKNLRFRRKARHVRDYPRIIDSRGRILRAPRKPAKAGELPGEPISPGIVRGKVKVLRRQDEKPVLPGEILVTRATDPGWTPLFLNAGGVVLEVGGLLQHGALVAREYGRPCVAGIEDAAKLLKDGQMVEVNGTDGIVRML